MLQQFDAKWPGLPHLKQLPVKFLDHLLVDGQFQFEVPLALVCLPVPLDFQVPLKPFEFFPSFPLV